MELGIPVPSCCVISIAQKKTNAFDELENPTLSHQSQPPLGGGMGHEEQIDPVAQSTSILPITSTVDLSERDNKETLVVKEGETNDLEKS